jgi:hypothetical protein
VVAGFSGINDVSRGFSLFFSRQLEITVPATLKPVKEKIAGCRLWVINDHGRPLVLSKLAELLKKNNVACEREEYNIYYFSARFAAADEVSSAPPGE